MLRKAGLVIFFVILCAVFITAALATTELPTNATAIISIVVVAVMGALGGIATIDQLRHRKKEIEQTRLPNEVAYLQGRLQDFGEAREQFVALSGSSIPRHDEKLQPYDDAIWAVKEKGFEQVVFVGDPGAGKSTSLKHLAAAAMRARLKHLKIVDPHSPRHPLDDLIAEMYPYEYESGIPLPLWIDMGYGDNPSDAMNLLEMWWGRENLSGTVADALRHNGVWLFLDGLNEVPEARAKRSESAKSLRELLSRYPKLRTVITCRINDYWLPSNPSTEKQVDEAKQAENENRLYLGCRVVRIHSLKPKQIHEFALKRFPNESEKATRFLHELKKDVTLGTLAQNPYTLVRLISVYDSNLWKEFLKTDQMERYNKLFDFYLQHRYDDYAANKRQKFDISADWRSENMTPLLHLSWETLKMHLQRFAYLMIAQQRGTKAGLPWAERSIGHIGRKVLEDGINLGVLIEESLGSPQELRRVIRFYHQSLQGYFALPLIQKNLNRRWYETRRVEDFFQRRLRLIKGISDLGSTAARTVPFLIKILSDKNEILRLSAIQALGQIGASARAAVDPLITMLQDKSVQQDVIEALGQIGESAAPAVQFLITMLQDNYVRRDVIQALGQIGEPAAPSVPFLVDTLSDNDIDIVQASANALGSIGHPAEVAIPDLINLLKRKPNFPSYVVEALGDIGIGIDALPMLLELWGDEHRHTRLYASYAIAKIGKPAIPTLIQILRNEEEKENAIYGASEALGSMGSLALPELIETLEYFRERLLVRDSKYYHLIPNMFSYTLSALEEIGTTAASVVPELIDMLNDKVPLENRQFLHKRIVEALGIIGANSPIVVIPPLIKVLQDADVFVRCEAVKSLGKVKPTDAQVIDALTRILKDKDEDNNVRISAVRTLGKIGDSAAYAVPILIEMMRDPDIGDACYDTLYHIDVPDAVAARDKEWNRLKGN